MFTFPAIAYTALTYGSILAWFSVCVSAYSVYFTLPPYNFSSAGVGLLNLAPFVGGIFGSIYGGIGSDWLIIRLSRRNNGIYEPEMRLWLQLPCVFIMPAGILMFGLSMARGMHWAIPAVGCGIFGFAFAALGDGALTYAMDCYKEVRVASLHLPNLTDFVTGDWRRSNSGMLHPERLRHNHRDDFDGLDQWRGLRFCLCDLCSAFIRSHCYDAADVDLGEEDASLCLEEGVVRQDEG